jgi:hypothetical protein
MTERRNTERAGKPASDQELAALADGTLGAERRREIENQLGNSGLIRESIHRQRAAIELTREIEVPASDALHTRVAEMSAKAAPRKRSKLAIGGFATAAAAALVVLALVVTSSGGPSVDQVVATAAQGATSDAPAKDPSNSKMLDVSVGSVQFPTWENDGGWWATGARSDDLDGRNVETVFYENGDGATMKYSVVGGAPIDSLDSASAHYEMTGSGDTRRIVWRAGGHTCIIEAQGVDSDQLERLIY